jgi:putative heme-binding domain-containing protein
MRTILFPRHLASAFTLAIAIAAPLAVLTPAALAAEAQPAQKPTSETSSTPPLSDADRRQLEADLLKDTKIPEGFDATIFAAPPMANYPVFVAAAPDGTLYVSSDGNGSLDRNPHRGRILRLRDLDGDGRADESKEFVKDVDSPRGLVWDHDRLYLLHPPHISEYIDKDGDGIADESRILVKNIAFTFKDRPADHTSNGLELGIDGWLYAAIGDFGFMEAEGTDGRKLQLRGGGVVRVRPDGTGLHVYSHGTRNILEAAVSPMLDVITRDNTNDGGGWDIRLHHNTGLANHGYPSLYKNFNDEIIQPLADYGGGSGCGAAWIDEPGIPAKWNNAPFTCDWGRNWIYQHRLTEKGATFAATQEEFFAATRPTDLDVDANSRIYISSWKGATFTWAGPNAGYIVQLRPKNFAPAPLPDFEKLSQKELLTLLLDQSHRRRLEAQRTLLRRKLVPTFPAMEAFADETRFNSNEPFPTNPSKVAAIYALAQAGRELSSLKDSQEYIIRAYGEPDHKLTPHEKNTIIHSLNASAPRVRIQAIIAAAFQNLTNATPDIALSLAHPDPVIAHTAVEALKRLEAANACWPIIDSADAPAPKRAAALRVLQSIHRADVIDGLTDRLQKEKDSARRQGLFIALCRLYHIDGVWKGDSWGTRPDTSGPYYQGETWSESPRILRALNDATAHAQGPELAAYAAQLTRHKVQSDEALLKIIKAAKADSQLLPAAAALLARAETVPSDALSLLSDNALEENISDTVRGDIVTALIKSKWNGAFMTIWAGVGQLEHSSDLATESRRRQIRSEFLNSGLVEQNIPMLAGLEKLTVARDYLPRYFPNQAKGMALLADLALVTVSERRNASPEAKEAAKAAILTAWKTPERRPQILKAIAMTEKPAFRDQILAALDDPDPAIAKAAQETAKAVRLERKTNANANTPASPKLETMTIPDAIAAAVKTKGDLATGQKLFAQQTCVNCHTVSEKEPARGPYLGNIAATYKRAELAEAILNPNKTIAQGFVANHFELKNGDEHDGFVTLEAADKVTIRDITSAEHTFATKDILKRQKLEKSLMPEGLATPLTLQEFASLLDYLENLHRENEK